MSVVYGIQEIHPGGAVYMQNTIYRSKEKARKVASDFTRAFPRVDCSIVSFWID